MPTDSNLSVYRRSLLGLAQPSPLKPAPEVETRSLDELHRREIFQAWGQTAAISNDTNPTGASGTYLLPA